MLRSRCLSHAQGRQPAGCQRGSSQNPLSGNVGSIDTAEFMQVIEDITNSKSDVILGIYAAEDIYTEGPVKIKFKIK